MKNSEEDELKRRRRSLLGKLKRREEAAFMMQMDARDIRRELREVEAKIAEYRGVAFSK